MIEKIGCLIFGHILKRINDGVVGRSKYFCINCYKEFTYEHKAPPPPPKKQAG